MPQERILIIGCGSIGERHLRAFLANGQLGVIAAEMNPELRERIGRTHGVETVADYREAIVRPGVVAALVATPAPSHVTIATDCLEHKRHVLIEKPLSLDRTGLDRQIVITPPIIPGTQGDLVVSWWLTRHASNLSWKLA